MRGCDSTCLSGSFRTTKATKTAGWLTVEVSAALGGRTNRRWSFSEPWLQIDEARELAARLRAVGRGQKSVDQDARYASLTFLEPVLGFALAARDTTTLLVRVFFASEGVPERARRRNPAGEVVDLRVRPDALLDVADEWDLELDGLPARP